MAFPSIAGTATTNGSTAATNKICNLPTGIVSGDLLLLLLRSAGADTHSTPTGWTLLFLNSTADASDDTTSLWYRQADGAEGGTVAVNGTSSLKYAALAWRITGHANPATQAPQFATIVTGTSASPNPGALSPTGGAKDYLWIWMGGWEGEQTSPPASNPTNYTLNVIGANSGTGGAIATNCRVAGAARQLNATSEDPPLWTISVSDDWTATTVAVHPPAPASPTRGLVSWVEAETPFVATRGLLSWVEAETPLAPTRGQVGWAEGEIPGAPTRGLLSWTEAEIPLQATRGRVSWSEAEVPLAPTRGQVSWAEEETPVAPTRGQLSWGEAEIPLALTRGRVSWAEGEVPAVGQGGPSLSQRYAVMAASRRRRGWT